MTASTPLHTGGCGCGAVRFEIDAPLLSASWCHCTRCQHRTGTAAAPSARITPGSLRLVQGEDRIRRWQPEGGFPKAFCGDCGSHLYSEYPDGGVAGVRFAAFDEDPGIRPQWRQYVAYAASWDPIPDDGLPRYPEARPA